MITTILIHLIIIGCLGISLFFLGSVRYFFIKDIGHVSPSDLTNKDSAMAGIILSIIFAIIGLSILNGVYPSLNLF
jgi:hypothetical protein